jgi:hypothetical protein
MTLYIPAYDVEEQDCLDAVKKIVRAHEKREAPATFFVAGNLLKSHTIEFKAILKGHPLFETALRASSELDRFIESGEANLPAKLRDKIVSGGEYFKEMFSSEAPGFRAQANGDRGLCDNEALLGAIDEAGFGYLSTLPKNPNSTLLRPRTHAEQGFPRLREFPPYKCNRQNVAFSPEGEFEFLYMPIMDRARAENLTHLSFALRSKELNEFDPSIKLPELIFEYALQINMQEGTFADLHREMLRKQHLASGRG